LEWPSPLATYRQRLGYNIQILTTRQSDSITRED